MIDVIDAVLALLEPGGSAIDRNGSVERVATSGVVVDLNAAKPFSWQPGHAYGWLEMDLHELAGVGNPPEGREVFALRLVYVADNNDEEASASRRRAVSEALDERGHAWLATVAANRKTASWAHLQGRLDYSYLTGIDVRGVAVVLDGYRYISS